MRVGYPSRAVATLIILNYSNEGVLGSIVPLLAYTLSPDTVSPIGRGPHFFCSQQKQRYDWNYTTTPQPGLNNHTIPYPRGRILGGSSSISKLFSSASPLHCLHLLNPLRLYGVQYGFQRRLGSRKQNHRRSRLDLGRHGALSRPEPEIRPAERWT